MDAGELAALALAELLHANILLMDDRKGYDEAIRRNLRAVGTLGVLAEAAAQQLIDLPQRFNKPKPLGSGRLRATRLCDFRPSTNLVKNSPQN